MTADDADRPDEGTPELVDPVRVALEDVFGPPPEPVEEQAQPKDPADENEAMAHLYRSPSRFYGLG